MDKHLFRQKLYVNPSYITAGMTEKQAQRAQEKLGRDERREARQARRLATGIFEPDDGAVSNPQDVPQLPDDFVELAVEQIRCKIRVGNFDALHGIADHLAVQWELRKLQDSPLAKRQFGERLATYLSECRDPGTGERINVRLVNAVETICPATLGSIREQWPMGFAACPNVGEVQTAMLGKVLVASGLLEPMKFEQGMAKFHASYKVKGWKA